MHDKDFEADIAQGVAHDQGMLEYILGFGGQNVNFPKADATEQNGQQNQPGKGEDETVANFYIP
jgi:hypothetical protein